jgi:uncharacterized protein
MPLLDQVRQDLTAAMKARDADRTQALRMLLAELQKEAVSAKPSEDLAVLRRLVSQRQEAEAAFRQGGADDRAEVERAQAEVYRAYLPAQLSDEELIALVEEAIAEAGATTQKQMGPVMRALQPRIAGRADNARVSTAVKQRLS